MSLPTWHFTDRTVIVTGAARGLGAAMSLAFVRAGARVAALDRDAEALGQAVLNAGEHAPALTIAVDVTDHDGLDRALDRVSAELGPIDVMVANAGIGLRGLSVDVSVADFEKVVDINLNGVFFCNRLAARRMIGRGGAIVNLASIMGFSGGIFPNAAYQASKGAVVNMTRALALEWAANNIRVNAVAPTFVRTPLTVPVFNDQKYFDAVMAHTPLGRLPAPDDIAQAVLFLASDAAQCVTGITLPVDSGYLAR